MRAPASGLIVVLTLLVITCSKDRANDNAEGRDKPQPSADDRIELVGGGSLALPEGATEQPRPASQLPANLLASRTYRLPKQDAVLVVNELKVGSDCKDDLDTEMAKTEQAKNDTNQQPLIRLDVLEWRQVGGMKAIYSEGGTRGPQQVQQNQPYHPVASLMVCKHKTRVGLFLTSPGKKTTDSQRKALFTTAESLQVP